MPDSLRSQRREVYYSGRVQGVGFRFTTQNVARQFDVTGFVRNLTDGRVHMVVEGDPPELDQFLAAVADRMAGCIDDVKTGIQATSGEFAGFTIRH